MNKPRISFITFGTSNLKRAKHFYEAWLGLTASSSSTEHILFYQLGDIVLGIWSREKLAEDAGRPYPPSSGKEVEPPFDGVAFARNLPSKEAVDREISRAVAAGGTCSKPAADTFWGGYSGYILDPDGHAWELAWNPHWPLDAEGRITLPK